MYAPRLPLIHANKDQLEQVFINILLNALQAMPQGGTITIRTQQKEKFVQISFEDTGYGISPKDIGEVFQPFFTTRPPGEGTGLGLSVSYGIIQSHG